MSGNTFPNRKILLNVFFLRCVALIEGALVQRLPVEIQFFDFFSWSALSGLDLPCRLVYSRTAPSCVYGVFGVEG